MMSQTITVPVVGQAISIMTIVGISSGLSSGLSISGPLAIVVAMMSVRVAIVTMMSITIPVVGQAISIMMTIVGISLSLGLGFSVSSDSCEKAESGNGNGFHLDCSLQARGVSWTPM